MTVALSLALASCSGGWPTSDCRAAATAQAEAEDVYLAAYAAHAADHAKGNDDHADSDDQLTTSRIDRILAREATARACR